MSVKELEPAIAPFSLNALVRETIDANPQISDPHVLGGLVAAAVPELELRAALSACLDHRVRTEYQKSRRAVYATALGDEETSPDVTPGKKAPRSAKWAAAGPLYKRWADLRVFTGVRWKTHAECDLSEVEAIAYGKSSQANALEVESKRYEMFAIAMRKAKVTRLGDLPEVAVLKVLRWRP